MGNSVEIEVLKEFSRILESLGIKYAIGGSLASSVYGQVRFTQDADIMLEPFGQKADIFYEKIQEHFYISKEAMQNAIKLKSSFNVIHLKTAFKIDIFVSKATAFDCQVFQRAAKVMLGQTKDEIFSFVSPEDIILLKLMWYEQGQRVSEKQWNDILGVLRTQKQQLDLDYLKSWAVSFEIQELLEKATQQSEL